MVRIYKTVDSSLKQIEAPEKDCWIMMTRPDEAELREVAHRYEIDLNDYVIPTPSGVYCLELGSIDPGVGCLARGVTRIDEMLDTQGVSNSLQLDFILYDISGETPCTGYILPIREGVMQRCIIVTNGSFASVTTANSILQAILRAAGADIVVKDLAELVDA